MGSFGARFGPCLSTTRSNQLTTAANKRSRTQGNETHFVAFLCPGTRDPHSGFQRITRLGCWRRCDYPLITDHQNQCYREIISIRESSLIQGQRLGGTRKPSSSGNCLAIISARSCFVPRSSPKTTCRTCCCENSATLIVRLSATAVSYDLFLRLPQTTLPIATGPTQRLRPTHEVSSAPDYVISDSTRLSQACCLPRIFVRPCGTCPSWLPSIGIVGWTSARTARIRELARWNQATLPANIPDQARTSNLHDTESTAPLPSLCPPG
jgi:hypothetical protein